jgi:hypothetical protein
MAKAARPLFRGQGNESFRTSDPRSAAKRGQTVPYNVNGAPTGAIVNDNSITNAKLADMAQATFKMRAAGAGPGDPIDGTAAQAKAALAIIAADVAGLGYFATGTDAANLTGTVAAARMPQFAGGDVTTGGAGSVNLVIGAGRVTLAMQANMATASVVYRKTAGPGPPEVQPLATLKADLGLTGTNSGDQMAAAQADSVAATVADLVTDFNALLAKLRAAQLLAP